MRQGIIITIILFLFSISIHTQEKQDKKNINIPAQALRSDKLKVNEIYFNKMIEGSGKGEILEVEFSIENKIDDPLDLYIFVIATFEWDERTEKSFERPIPEKDKIRNFVASTSDIRNFQYRHPKKKGESVLLKYPKDPKAGVNPSTGKPYHIIDYIFVRTYHLSRYRNRYYFFNEVALQIFDKDGELLFNQLYDISKVRR